MKISIILLSAILFLVTGTNQLFAQNKLNGNWVIGEHATLYGTNYANSLPNLIKITQTSDSVIIIRTSFLPDSDENVIEVFSINGQSAIFRSPAGRKETANIKWAEDRNSLIEISIYDKKDNDSEPEFKITEDWTIGPDGKLTVARSFQSLTNPNNKWAARGVFSAQSDTDYAVATKLRVYQFKKDGEKYSHYLVLSTEQKIRKNAPPDPIGLNQAAWDVFQFDNDPSDLEKALNWAANLNLRNVNPDGNEMDTQAELLYKLGRKKEAIKLEQSALAAAAPRNVADITVGLEKMKKGERTWPEKMP